jgi:hypothetical protein
VYFVVEELLFPVLFDDGQHGVGVGRFFEGFPEFGLVQQFGNVRERVEMLLELSLRHEEEHDEFYRLVVERVEVDALRGAAQRADNLVNQIRRGVRDADAKPDAGGHGRLALFDGGGDGVAVGGLNLAGGDKVPDEFVNCLPAVRRAQVWNYLFAPQNIG